MGSLEQDYTTVPGQLYSCLSIVGPECPQKNEKFGIKIRGSFNTRAEPTRLRRISYAVFCLKKKKKKQKKKKQKQKKKKKRNDRIYNKQAHA